MINIIDPRDTRVRERSKGLKGTFRRAAVAKVLGVRTGPFPCPVLVSQALSSSLLDGINHGQAGAQSRVWCIAKPRLKETSRYQKPLRQESTCETPAATQDAHIHQDGKAPARAMLQPQLRRKESGASA